MPVLGKILFQIVYFTLSYVYAYEMKVLYLLYRVFKILCILSDSENNTASMLNKFIYFNLSPIY